MKTDYSDFIDYKMSRREDSNHSGRNRRNERQEGRSTAGELFRTLILVTALLGIPTLAIYWDRLPAVPDKVADMLHLNRATAQEPVIEHHAAEPNSENRQQESENPFQVEKNACQAAHDRGEVPGNDPSSSAFLTENNDFRTGGMTPIAVSENGVTPFSGAPPVNLSLVPEQDDFAATPRSVGNLENADRSEPLPEGMTAELTRFGAERNRLTRWGAGGNLWRFTCRARCAAGRPAREFEGIGRTPESAVMTVIERLNETVKKGE